MPLNLSALSQPPSLSLAAILGIAAAFSLLLVLLLLMRQQKQQRQQEIKLQNSLSAQATAEQQRQEQEAQNKKLEAALEQIQAQAQAAERQLAASQARLESEAKANDDKIRLLTEAREELKHQFKNTAQEIFEQKSKQFGERSQEQIGQLLNPFAQELKGFKKTVEDKFQTEGKERASLQGEISSLVKLNQQVTEEAQKLSNALTGQNKTQGNWGEIILQTVLEKAGLKEGMHFEQQTSARNEDNQLIRPDVVLYMPQDRIVVIDSKVSLNAYSNYCNADNEADKKLHLAAHVRSIRQHIDGLAKKSYETAYPGKSLDFVFMFMPIDQAYLDATQSDLSLIAYGLDKKIVIVSPYSLYPNLKTVEMLWRNHEQNQNAVEIARIAGTLYDKIADSEGDLRKVQSSLDKAQKHWGDAWSRLATGKGNALRTAEKLKELGVKTKKQIQQDDSERLVDLSGTKPANSPQD